MFESSKNHQQMMPKWSQIPSKIDEKSNQLSGPNHNILVFKFELDFKDGGRFKPSTFIFEILKSEFLNLAI